MTKITVKSKVKCINIINTLIYYIIFIYILQTYSTMFSGNRKSNEYKNKCGEILLFSINNLALICDICGEDYYTLEVFGAHILQDHAPEPAITTCIKLEDSSIDIITEAAPKQTYDSQRISRQSNTLHHKPNNGIEKPQYSTANKCGEIFNFSEDKFTLVCDKCYDNYYTLEAFGVHIIQDHSTPSNDANNSPSRPLVEVNLKVEPREEHDANVFNESNVAKLKWKSKKPFQCSFCDRSFTTNRYRDDHENTHMGRHPYECYICQKAYTAHSALQMHLRLHTTDLPHKCLVCGKSFLKNCRLEHHTREKHLPVTDPRRLFPCKDCDKIFKTYSNRSAHAVTMHRPGQLGIFICGYCQKSFPTRKKLVRHIPRHVAKEKYNCGFCDRSFSNHSSHKIHENKHRGTIAPVHQCQICLKSYQYSQSLNRHLKNVHTDKKKKL